MIRAKTELEREWEGGGQKRSELIRFIFAGTLPKKRKR